MAEGRLLWRVNEVKIRINEVYNQRRFLKFIETEIYFILPLSHIPTLIGTLLHGFPVRS